MKSRRKSRVGRRKRETRKRKMKGGDKNNIYLKLTGGLGNRLFQIFAGYGFAEKWNMNLYVLKEGSKWNHVSEDESFTQIRQLLPNLKIKDKISTQYDTISNSETYNNPNKDIILEGYFQDPSLFPNKHIELHFLEPKDNIIKNKKDLYFIHFRFGDFKGIQDYQLPLEYYKKALKNFDINSQFIIISDEIELAKKYIEDNFNLQNVLYDNSKSRIDSLYYMSKCKGGISSNSTFSWMGAYSIKDKDIICMPKPWTISYTKDNIYPSWATLIEYNQEGGNKKNKILINFADKGYENAKKSQRESAKDLGKIDTIIEYSLNDIDNEFKEKNKEILSLPRGAGYWIWKPYFILKTLNTMNDNDVLIYCDTAMNFVGSLDPYIENMKSSIMVFQHGFDSAERSFTKGDIFKKFNCKDNKDITDSTQLDGSHSIWKKDEKSLAFVKEWLENCCIKQLVTDDPSIEPNLDGFAENRHDQSLLSILAKLNKDKYNIQIEYSATDYGNEKRDKKFPQLLHHHRWRN